MRILLFFKVDLKENLVSDMYYMKDINLNV